LVLDGGLEIEGVKGSMSIVWGEESATHILLHCQATQRWRETFLGKQGLQMNDMTRYLLTNLCGACSKTTDLSKLGIFVYKVRGKCQQHTKHQEAL
jgi:hypothetical protein